MGGGGGIRGYLIREIRVRTPVTRLAVTINSLCKVTTGCDQGNLSWASLFISSIWGHRYNKVSYTLMIQEPAPCPWHWTSFSCMQQWSNYCRLQRTAYLHKTNKNNCFCKCKLKTLLNTAIPERHFYKYWFLISNNYLWGTINHDEPWPVLQFINPIHSRQNSLNWGSARRKALTYSQKSINTE
jgi:hypothetical protein